MRPPIGGVMAGVVLSVVSLVAGWACGNDEPAKSLVKEQSTTTSLLETLDSAATGGYSADERGVETDGTTTLSISITAEAPDDVVESAIRVIGTRLRSFGAAPAAVERDGQGLVVSWDRRNVADEVAAVITSRGHFQIRPVLEVLRGACKIETPVDQVAPEIEVRLSSLTEPAYCHRLGPSELSDPQVDQAVPRLVKRWQVDVTLGSTAANQFADVAKRHLGKKLAIVVDGILQSVPQMKPTNYEGPLIITGGFTEAAARLYAALLDGGAHALSLRADKLDRSS